MIISIILLFILLLLCYYVTKNILHPAIITNSVWLFVLLGYKWGQGELYDISEELQCLIVAWCLIFSLGSVFLYKIKIRPNNHIFFLNLNRYNYYYSFTILSTIILIVLLIQKAGGINTSMIINLRETQLEETNPLIILFYYVNSFCIVFLAFSLLEIKNINRKKIIVLFLLLFILSILKTNKTGIIQLFFIFGYSLYKQNKISIKKMLLLSLSLMAILYFFTLMRDSDNGEFDLARYASIYALSPLPALDMVLSGEVPIYIGSWGSSIFSFFYNIAQGFGLSFSRTEYATWVSIPYPTNVFTILGNYYADFGVLGVLIGSFLFGGIWGIIFKLQSRNYLVATLFYSVMVYALFFQFFADIFWGTFSITLQYLFSAIIIKIMLTSTKNEINYAEN